VTGDPVPAERQLDLPGYPGAPDVYAGNHAGSQFQLDVFGEALTVLADAGEADRLDGDGWRAIEVAIAAIEQRWAEPDAGVWELDARHWAHSRFACASGLRAVAERLPAGPTAGRCLSLADALVASADRDCLHPSGRWQRAPSDPRIDASLLLAQVRGVVPVDDPRSTLTRRAVADELLREGYVYRYQAEGVALGRAEGAFLLCGFWLALAAAQAGDPALAARVFERNRSACGPPGILTEEFDVHQRQLRGNFPQAFVHALLLETSVALADVLVPL